MLELLVKMLDSGQTLFGLYTVMIVALLIIWRTPPRILDQKYRPYLLAGIFIMLLALTIATIINGKNTSNIPKTPQTPASKVEQPGQKTNVNVCGNIVGSNISIGSVSTDCSPSDDDNKTQDNEQ